MAKRDAKRRRALKLQSDKVVRRLQDPISFENLKFIWRVHNDYIDYNHPQFGWDGVNIVYFLKKIIQSLQGYEGFTWQEVMQKKHCHPWGVDDIPRECAKRLVERQIDIEQLYQIPLGSLPRIIGYRDRQIFYLMWWDGKHEFCPTKVK